MTAEAAWLDGNNAYLAASLHWLRLRLRRLAPPDPATDAKVEPAAPPPDEPARAIAAPASTPPVTATTTTPPMTPPPMTPPPMTPPPVTPPPVAPPAAVVARRGWFRRTAPIATVAAPPTTIATVAAPSTTIATVAAPPAQIAVSAPKPATSSASSARTSAESPARGAGTPPMDRRVPTPGDQASRIDAAVAEAASRREAAAAIDPPPALLLVAERLGLSVFERDTLLLCAAAELDPATEALFAAVQGGPARAFPTFSLALRVLDDPTWDALSPHRPLRYARLLELNQPGATPLTSAALRADERIVNFLKGMNVLDERVATLVAPVAGDRRAGAAGSDLAPSQQVAVDALLEQLRAGADESKSSTVHLLGADAGAKLAIARELSDQLHRQLYVVGLDALPTARGEIDVFIRLWQRETALLPVALYLDAENFDGASAEHAAAFHALTAQDLGLMFVALRDAPARAATSRRHVIEVEKPTPTEQRDAWLAVLPEAGTAANDAAAKVLAGQFNLNLHDIRQAAELAARSARAETAMVDRAWDACRSLTQPRLDALAQRLVPKATWDDLVVSEESTALLRQIAG